MEPQQTPQLRLAVPLALTQLLDEEYAGKRRPEMIEALKAAIKATEDLRPCWMAGSRPTRPEQP